MLYRRATDITINPLKTKIDEHDVLQVPKVAGGAGGSLQIDLSRTIKGLVTKFPAAYKHVVAHSESSETISEMSKQGFPQLQQEANMYTYNGIRRDDIDSFKTNLIDILEIPKSKVKQFEGIISNFKLAEKNESSWLTS